MMVAHLLAFVKLDTFILVSITLVSTSIDVCTSMDGGIPFVDLFSSYASFYVGYASINCYSTPLSSNFSMFTISINVVFGLAYTLELQPLLRLGKNSTIDVPVLYIS
jgi:hypothetical protein